MDFPSIEIIFLALFLLLSAFFSASETALISLGKVKILSLIEKDPSKAKAWKILLEDPQRFLVTILIGNNIANIAASALATSLSLRLFASSGVSIAVGVMTFLILVFGEITPKGLALRYAEDFAKRVVYIMYVLSIVAYPFASTLSKLANMLARGDKRSVFYPLLTREELEMLISQKGGEVELEESEKKIIKGVIELEDKIVREIMVPRLDMVCLDALSTVRDAVKVIEEYGHSRIPVYESTVDNIVGVLYAKDLIPIMAEGRWDEKVGNFVRPPYFVPETKLVKELFEELREKKIHIAIVIDEYGGTAGLVTMEDILEEIVGEIEDEYDKEPPTVEKVDDNTFIVDGRLNMEDLLDLLEMDIDLDERDYDTVAGLIYSIFGRIPQVGEEAEFKGLRLRVLEVRKNRIKKVLVSRLLKEEKGLEKD